jgi:signal transduction histidine kinase
MSEGSTTDRLPASPPLADALCEARTLITSAPVKPAHRPLVGLVLAAIERALRLIDPRRESSTDTVGAWEEELDAPRLYQEALDLLEERRRKALEINDDIVQRLTIAKLALDLGRRRESEEALDGALTAARRIIGDLLTGGGGELHLGPGDLRNGDAAAEEFNGEGLGSRL